MKSALPVLTMLAVSLGVAAAHAAEPVASPTVESPTEIAADEPLATSFSLELAAQYLDRAALDWQKKHACIACHTMLSYMIARPVLDAVRPQPAEVRQFFEEIAAGKRDPMPAYECKDIDGAVAVGLAAALALNDRWSTGKLHPLSRQALDRMWTAQRSDGGWQWPFRDTPPLKVDEHYGVTLAAIAVGMAPDDYAATPAAQAGRAGIRRFLANSKPVSLHHRAMMLWASVYVDGLLSRDAQAEILASLLAAQRPDGGWSMASLVDNTGDPSLTQERVVSMKTEKGYGTEFLAYIGPDRAYKSSLASDGYATGFAILVARQAGVAATDHRLQRGIAWLKTNQRASGRWFTPSQAWHTRNLISNAGTAYAVLALHACGEVPGAVPARAAGGN